jgi:hypothetical protein
MITKTDLDKLNSQNPKVKYRFAKELLKIGYLSAVDKDNRVEGLMSDLIQMLHGGMLITCNHAIFAPGLIYQNKPNLKDLIIKELISIPHDKFETDACKNIATEKVLEAIKPFVSDIKNDQSVMTFIENATKSERNATKKKAEQLLKK